MVGKTSAYADHTDIGDAVFAEHLLGDLGSGVAAADLGVFVELSIQDSLDESACYHHGNHYNPDIHQKSVLTVINS